ncbi:hypothetical protein IMG5_063810 [Ichthyophthirius multifiliis]|uniref:Histidine kinase/HSP90-like ATPase domain-containing protein n=1 Tax=Ichthyophthirius multifiliis TaxID=5932 RepID=G0QP44_ICHMU|nr:hypothetical protein IMG5_063810 [Ichthyophthirius multifiliis]EGR33010.1 hypothetical protein IMG5_063810 [Ichthyophthirius multifiliis]|eukprot:XP_004036996.1 hypothetical protein IMG5_063810 [Ichthyophthirius multifiliis]
MQRSIKLTQKAFQLASKKPSQLRSFNCLQKFPFYRFSSEVNIEEPIKQNIEQMQFKTETKKLLDIVAKSLYTDKDVFLRELLSNASDAIEKQRFRSTQKTSGDEQTDSYQITITTDSNKRQLIIQDTGVGFTRQQLIDDLGTIARSGSQQFVKEIGKNNNTAENIIGQFGVGFYSSFIVGDNVQVISKSDQDSQAHMWQSDGSGEFEISAIDNFDLKRGTKIIIHLKPDCAQFANPEEIKKIAQRYSNFINYPIQINGERFNLVEAIWAKSKINVTDLEYSKFWEFISNTKSNYFSKLHYEIDVPLSIKCLLYIPSTHVEKMGISHEEMNVSLYCKKVLIKQNCKELMPSFLRFVKGVVDCEDIPLNISRENYQDSGLIAKLRQVVTKRVLKHLDEEANKNPEAYNKWYNDFQNFIKEGLAMDMEYQEQLFKLCRFNVDYTNDYITLDDYVSKMKPGQDKIYYALLANREAADQSPFIEPFKGTGVPIIYTFIHIDEMIFQTTGNYKNHKFVNVEGDFEEISKDIQKFKQEIEQKDESQQQQQIIPEEEVTAFCLWIKNELSPMVSKVQVSQRLSSSPAVIQSQMTSGMRQVMLMMDRTQNLEMAKNLTFEINPKHPLIVKINEVRKFEMDVASTILRQLCDNCLISSGIPTDNKKYNDRINVLMSKVLENALNQNNNQQN